MRARSLLLPLCLAAFAAGATLRTQPAARADPQAVATWRGAAGMRFFVADQEQGLETYDGDGRRLAALAEYRALQGLDLRRQVELGGRRLDLLVGADPQARGLVLFEVAGGTARPLGRLGLDFAPRRVCLHRSGYGALQAFVFDESGRVRQLQLLQDSSPKAAPAARSIREFHVGGEIEACAVDDTGGSLFVAEGRTAIWRYGADAEAPAERQALAVGAPLGALGTVGGLAVAESAQGAVLLAAEEDAERLLAFALAPPYAALAPVPLGALRSSGLLAALPGDARVLVGEAATGAFALLPPPPLQARTAPRGADYAMVRARAQTAPVGSTGDAADDPAIWVHPHDAARSLVIGSDKQRGLNVYGLDGGLRQSLELGRINNVDLRSGFALGGRERTLVAASNRSDDTLTLLTLDDGVLHEVARIDSGLSDPYGLCLYRSARDGAFYAILNDSDGRWRQWRLRGDAAGHIAAELLREFRFDSQPEGCVADDDTGVLFAGEEDAGVWKLGAEPDAGAGKTRIDHTGEGGGLVADVEGMGLWRGAGGRGWLVVSSQGEDAYAVYQRETPHRLVGKFRIVGDAATGIDGASETDGLDLTSARLGGDYARGLLVVQDGRKVSPPDKQNFKLVPWSAVEQALRLPVLAQ